MPFGHDDLPMNGLPRLPRLTPMLWLRLQGLTPREAEAALRAAGGKRLRAVAEDMQIAEGTAKVLLSRARHKLGCDTLRELTVEVLRGSGFSPEEFFGETSRRPDDGNAEVGFPLTKDTPKVDKK